MFKFLKKHKLTILLAGINALLLAGTAIATLAWYSQRMEITPPTGTTQTSGILTSYFDSGTGTSGDPYVITRPIHFYHLSYLQNSDYFGDEVKYFQFGKDLDNDASNGYEFYNYDNDGKLSSGYSKSLNVKYYSGERSLYPIGTSQHPFKSVIRGSNLTVDNVSIIGTGFSDIGIFGYVDDDAEINNLYFDNVHLDIGSPITSDTYHSHDDSKYNVGFIAGHIQTEGSFHNVYVNNCEAYNGSNPGQVGKTHYGYFGMCDTVETPLTNSETDEYQINPSTVQGYLNSNWTSGKKLSSKSVAAQNTEYSPRGISFSSAVNKSSSNYTMKGTADSSPYNYSLSTIGHQAEETSYEISYIDGGSYLDMDEDTIVLDSGEDIEDVTTPGTYVYYNGAKWVYYVVSAGGSTSQKTFNVFTMSYEYNGNKYYVYVNGNVTESNGVRDFSGLSFGVTYYSGNTKPSLSDKRYWFSFRTSNVDPGLDTLATNSGINRYHIYSPDTDSFVYITNNTTINFGDYTTISGLNASGSTASFTIEGVDSTIMWTGASSTPYGFQANASTFTTVRPVSGNDATTFAFNGNGNRTSESSSATDKYTLVTDISDLKNGLEYSIGYNSDSTYRLIGEQRSNNRAAITVTVDSGTTLNTAAGVKRFTLGIDTTTITDTTAYSFFDAEANSGTGGYLYAASSSKNYLRTTATDSYDENGLWTISIDSDGDATITAQGNNTHNLLRYNANSGTNGNLFSSYASGQQLPEIYRYVQGGGTIYTANCSTLRVEVVDGDDMDRDPFEAKYDANTGSGHNYQDITFIRDRLTWDFTNHLITVSPETSNEWVKITSTSELEDGEYLIVSEHNNSILDGSAASGGSKYAVTISTGKIAYSDETYARRFTYDSDSQSLCSAHGEYIYANSTSGSNSIRRTDTLNDSTSLTITFSSGDASISSSYEDSGQTKTKYLRNYNDSDYRMYVNEAQASTYNTQLYKLVSQSNQPEYIADAIAALDSKYDKTKIDAVGSVTFTSSTMNFNSNISNIKSVNKWHSDNSADGINAKFYQTKYLSNSLVLFIPNNGSLDFGTIHLQCTSTSTPVFVKGTDPNITDWESSIRFSDDRINCSNDTNVSNTYDYTLSLNRYNIFNLCYAALDSSGRIIASYDTDGAKVIPAATVNISSIKTFVLAISVPASSMSVSTINLKIHNLTGDMANFSNVGYRNASYSGTATTVDSIVTNDVTAASVIEREVIDFRIDSGSATNKIYFRVIYTPSSNTYDITFKCTSNTTIYIFNYDAERVKLWLNNTQLTESYEEHAIPGASWSYPVAAPSHA